MKLKFDLHTHCLEATGFARPDADVVQKIVASVKGKGLDGIAVTDHGMKHYGFQIKELAESYLDKEVIIIPGQEIDRVFQHVVELYLPDGSVFRFVAHPGYPSNRWAEDGRLDDIHGVEIANGNWSVDKELVREVARKHDLLLLSNSDAHQLDSIGLYYNEVDLQELSERANRNER